MCVLSIQSRVASGYVGNTAAVPCLQRLGLEALAVDTILLSNHPAHGAFRGGRRPPGEIADLIAGIAEHRGFAGIDAVLSGYLGDPATGPIVEETVAAVKAANADALYCLDPVIGDHGRVYVDPALVDFFRGPILGSADVITPNAFEAGVLLGDAATAPRTARAALAKLRRLGPERVVVTGIPAEGGAIVNVAADSSGEWQVTVPRVEAPESGAGDAFTAVLLGVLLKSGGDLPAALGHAAAAIHAALDRTAAAGLADLALIATLDAIVRPPRMFPVERLR